MINKHFKIKRAKYNLVLIFLRIILSLIIFLLILYPKGDIVVYFFVFTVIVAFLDGILTKRRQVRSQLRSILEPFADKLLINLTAIALFFKGILPFWIMIVFLVKDLLVVVGALFILIKNTKTIFRTNLIDKISVFIQLFTLFAVLMGYLDYILVWISMVFVVLSFIIVMFKSGIRVVRYRTDLEEIRLRKLVKLPDIFTLANTLMGLLAISLAINGNYYGAMVSLLAAVFFDYLDGKVARLIKRTGEFGKQLDSLADTISFGVAPAIFGFTLLKNNFAIITLAIFLFASVLRLARYNIMQFNEDFAGMPITVNGIVIPLIYLLRVPVKAYPYIYLFLAILMVSPLKFKKLI